MRKRSVRRRMGAILISQQRKGAVRLIPSPPDLEIQDWVGAPVF